MVESTLLTGHGSHFWKRAFLGFLSGSLFVLSSLPVFRYFKTIRAEITRAPSTMTQYLPESASQTAPKPLSSSADLVGKVPQLSMTPICVNTQR